jgi:RNA 2',3'-cyclic 3'-phosphodiesterase
VRAFLAVNLPPATRVELYGALEPLRTSLADVRWLPAESLHMTLKFLGDVEGPDVERISATASDVLVKYPPMTLSMGGVGGFPSIRRANIVWIGVAVDPTFERMQRDVELAMSRLGFAREQRPFRGHITVGRAKSEARAPSLERIAGSVEYRGTIDVTAVELMRSHTDAAGARYETLTRYPLGPKDIE